MSIGETVGRAHRDRRGGWLIQRNVRAVQEQQVLDELGQLMEKEDFDAAFRVLYAKSVAFAGNPGFLAKRNALFLPGFIRTSPPDAEVFGKGFGDVAGEWVSLGRTPIGLTVPPNYFRWRIVKAGYETFEGAGPPGMEVTLSPTGTVDNRPD